MSSYPIELATGYISITAETSKVASGIAKAIRDATKQSHSAGRDIGTGMSSGLESVRSVFDRTVTRMAANAAQAIGTNISDAFHVVKNVGLGAIGALGAAVAGLAIKGGISRALAIDDARAKLKGLGHSTEDMATIADNAMSAVIGTIYNFDQAVGVAATSVAAGVEPGEDLQRVLSLIADTAYIAGTDMHDAGDIFNKVAASGKLSAREMNQLAHRGINIQAALAEQYGVTQEEVRDLVSEGKVSFEDFLLAMEDTLGGASQSSESFRGELGRVEAALNRLGEAAARPWIANLKAIFAELPALIDAVTQKLFPFHDELAALKDTAVELHPVTQDIIEGIRGLTDALEDSTEPWEGLGTTALPIIGGIVGLAGPLLTRLPLVGSAFAGLTGPVGFTIGLFAAMLGESDDLRDALGDLFDAVKEPSKDLLPLFVDLLSLVVEWLGELGDAIAPVVSAMAPFVEEVLEALTPVLEDLVHDLLPLLLDASLEILEEVWPVVVDLLPVITELVVALLDKLGDFTDWLSENPEVVESFTDSLRIAAEVFVHIYDMGSRLISWIRNVFAPKFMATGTEVEEHFAGIGEWFKGPFVEWFKDAGNRIREDFERTKAWVTERLDAIKDGGSEVAGFFSNDVPEAFRNARDWVTDRVTEMRDNVVDASERMAEGFRRAWDRIREAAAKPVNFVIERVYNDGIRRVTNAVIRLFGGDELPEARPVELARGAIMGDGQRPILWNEVKGKREAYIPIDHSARSKDLLKQTASELGMVAFARGGIWPTSGTITSTYGPRWGSHHDGIDIGAPTGTPVVSVAPGVVTVAGWNGGYGNYVEVDHGGWQTFYAHLSSIATSLGQLVDQGSLLGAVGSTGFSTGSHLHFGLRLAGASADPMSILNGSPPAASGGILGALMDIPGKFAEVREMLSEIGSTPWAGILSNLGSWAIDRLSDWLKERLTSWLPSFGGHGSFDGWWAEAVSIAGPQWAQYYDAVAQVAQHESGMNPNAANYWDSNAAAGIPSKGLLQFIEPTFRAYAWPGYNDWLNPVHQILAFFKYVPARYGSIWNHPGLRSMASGGPYVGYWQGTNFARSGPAWVGEHGPELVVSKQLRNMAGGEKVIPLSTPTAFDPESIGESVADALDNRRVMLLVDGKPVEAVVRSTLRSASSGALTSRLGG